MNWRGEKAKVALAVVVQPPQTLTPGGLIGFFVPAPVIGGGQAPGCARNGITARLRVRRPEISRFAAGLPAGPRRPSFTSESAGRVREGSPLARGR